ncbi:RraA family protein [Pseudomonadales bacterium]|jgi:4-hydroxy-4-methyl-2-oxoglutarate aldolase|nr:RraA family protein [Pseudomonadales bacterium]
MHNEIIELIQKNRVSTTEIADALGKKGAIPGMAPLNPGHFVVGKIHYVCTWDESNWPLHEQIQIVPEDSIVYVDAYNCENKAIFGDIVAKVLLLYNGVRGVVVDGLLRDVNRLKKENYPLWCTGVSPIGCFNRDVVLRPEVEEYQMLQRAKYQDAILVADDSGCVVIESGEQNRTTLQRLEYIELQEDIWYFCIDTLKLSTYETICKKIYLTSPDLLPVSLRKRMIKYKDLLL